MCFFTGPLSEKFVAGPLLDERGSRGRNILPDAAPQGKSPKAAPSPQKKRLRLPPADDSQQLGGDKASPP